MKKRFWYKIEDSLFTEEEGKRMKNYEKKQEKRVTKKEFSIKNVIEEWNNLTLWKKIGCMMLVMCLWMVIVDEWLGLDDIIDAIW